MLINTLLLKLFLAFAQLFLWICPLMSRHILLKISLLGANKFNYRWRPSWRPLQIPWRPTLIASGVNIPGMLEMLSSWALPICPSGQVLASWPRSGLDPSR
jgi:hypothetical protein